MKAPVIALVGILSASPALSEDGAKFPATLAGHSLIPAGTFVTPPADAPADLTVAGKFAAPDMKRVDTLGAIAGTSFLGDKTAPRATGASIPVKGQVLQGLSGIKVAGDGTYWMLSDNGFGSRMNSPDAMLMLHHVRPDWTAGSVEVIETVFLSDPGRKVPFRIVTDATDSRYLTGADFDIESIQPAGDGFWLGDEFGPYLVRVNAQGHVETVVETEVNGAVAKSPDHFSMAMPATPTGELAFTVRRSRGYEGMASSPDGTFLYPLLEGPIWDAATKDWEKVDGKTVLRVLEYSPADAKWTGRHWFYPLEDGANNIGDFNMIDAGTALVIERDNGEGTADMACPEGAPAPDCFNVPAKFKRIYKIVMGDASVGKMVRKVGYVDLMEIADPDGKARQGGADGAFTFPFVTIEDVDVVSPTQIIVANDNNYPYSAGRKPQGQDDNELILLDVPELMAAQ